MPPFPEIATICNSGEKWSWTREQPAGLVGYMSVRLVDGKAISKLYGNSTAKHESLIQNESKSRTISFSDERPCCTRMIRVLRR